MFRGLEGIEVPSNPESHLRDAANWVPLTALRSCERLSRQREFAYHVGRAYFTRGRKDLPSLFEIIVGVLNDVRSVLLCANLWGSVQTNYLKRLTPVFVSS